MTSQDFAAEFRERGYAVRRGFYTEAEAAAMLKDIQDAGADPVKPSALNRKGLVFYSNAFHRSPNLQKWLSEPRLVELLRPVIGDDFWVRWDQAVLKQPGGAEFPWHQDNAYNGMKDEHYQLWIALSKSTAERGGLWVAPGSHKDGLLPHNTTHSHKVFLGPAKGAVAVDAEPGDVLLFSSYLLHYTAPNRSAFDRWAYVAEFVKTDHFDPTVSAPYFMVAEDGRSKPEMVNWYRGRLNPLNQLKYALPRLGRAAVETRDWVRSKLRRLG